MRVLLVVAMVSALGLPAHAETSPDDSAFPGNPAEVSLFKAWWVCEIKQAVATDAKGIYDVRGVHPTPESMADLIGVNCIDEAGALLNRMNDACFDVSFTVADARTCAGNVQMQMRETAIRAVLAARRYEAAGNP